MRRKIFAGLLMLAMMLTMIPVEQVSAETVSGSNLTVSGNSAEYVPNDNIELTDVGDDWDGETITSVNDLKAFAGAVNAGNTFEGKTVTLTSDLDLNNEEWTPIGYQGKTFKGIFDGGNHVIKNLKITKTTTNSSENNGIGLFGRTDSPAVIQNLTIENVDITGSLYVGAVVGYGYTGQKIENVTVRGNITIDAWWYAGVIGGNGYLSTVNNCHVIGNDGSYIKGNDGSYIGGIWGFRGEGGMKITNCSVDNIDITGVDRVGGICGISHYENVISGCTVKNTNIAATDADATTVGLIVGACQGTESGPSVFENNQVYSNSAAMVNGKEISGMYGTNISGTTPVVSVDGSIVSNEIISYQAEVVDGIKYESLNEAIEAANEGEVVRLASDVDYGTDQLKIEKKITLDLNGHTLTTGNGRGGISVKNGASIINGTIDHLGRTAAIKVWNAERFEDLTIKCTPQEGKTIGGIVVQSGTTSRVDSIKNVTITGVSNGIETYNCGDAAQPVIGSMEKLNITASENGLLILAPCGAAKDCNISSEKIGINLFRKGPYSAILTLENCQVSGNTVAIYIHDEVFEHPDYENSGKLELNIDSATILTAAGQDIVAISEVGAEENVSVNNESASIQCVEVQNVDEGTEKVYYTEHSYVAEWSYDEDGHYHICEQCGGKDQNIAHSYVIDDTTAKKATCTEAGYEGDKKCECGSEVKGEALKATGHKFENGICVNGCGEKKPVEQAKPENNKNEESDSSKPVETYIAVPQGTKPATGDSSMTALWICVLAAAVIAAVGTVVYRKKKNS